MIKQRAFAFLQTQVVKPGVFAKYYRNFSESSLKNAASNLAPTKPALLYGLTPKPTEEVASQQRSGSQEGPNNLGKEEWDAENIDYLFAGEDGDKYWDPVSPLGDTSLADDFSGIGL